MPTSGSALASQYKEPSVIVVNGFVFIIFCFAMSCFVFRFCHFILQTAKTGFLVQMPIQGHASEMGLKLNWPFGITMALFQSKKDVKMGHA